MPCSRENILLNFEFKDEATRVEFASKQKLLKWRPFWNKVYMHSYLPSCRVIADLPATLLSSNFPLQYYYFSNLGQEIIQIKKTYSYVRESGTV